MVNTTMDQCTDKQKAIPFRSASHGHSVVSHLGRERQQATGGRVDASPERLRPKFDGGTGARTVRATQTIWAGCIPTFGRNYWMLFGAGYKARIRGATDGRGRELFKE